MTITHTNEMHPSKKIKYTEIFKNINMYITLLSKYLNKD